MKQIEYSSGKKVTTARFRLSVCLVIGIFTYLIANLFGPSYIAILAGWDMAAISYLLWVWRIMWPLDANLTKRHALREDPSHATAETVILAASVASIAAIGAVLLQASDSGTVVKLLHVGFSIINIAISWVVVHTIYTLRYAEEYYGGTPGGVDFAGTRSPAYADIAYLSFTIGMTFQVSDTTFTTTRMRRIALRHALLSYVFGAVIVAITINLVAGLSK